MFPYAIALLFCVLSLVISYIMIKKTNQYIKNDKYIEENIVRPYEYKKNLYGILVGIAIISTFCGYVISQNVVSTIAMLELGICYLAVLASAIIDYRLKIIPNYISVLLVIARIGIAIYELAFMDKAIGYILSSLVGLFFCLLFFLIANRFAKGGIGGGDIKLLCSIGFVCGIYVVFSTLMIALVSCILINGFQCLIKKKSMNGHIAFGPYIYIGFVVMCLFTLY